MRYQTLIFAMAMTLIFILAGCRDNSPIVVEEQTETIDQEETSLVEETVKDETVEIIEFQLKEEIVKISLADIPIIDHYLAQHQNRTRAIEQMTLAPIELTDKTLYILTFAKQDTTGSYLLINTSEQTSVLIADQVTLERYDLLNEETLLFNFSESHRDVNLNRHQLLAYNTDKLASLPLVVTSDSLSLTPLSLQTFTWPFIDVVIHDNETIHLTLPAIIEPTDEAINTWASLDEAPTQMVDVTIE
ncbi:hypothetical protein SAMN05421839_10819 [Halolactibacillus halophilus]|uniref:Lipoprotein n=1 Tax=Halolactibacillus halophilus TaxID=306540 RepID=A0A1I5N7L5_9BACI|nr:hypothetical protein [Halolactibacillus halophilus]GEM01199.1 hypothetical protein HHA03_07310 [Halolactibacillus halophilus]SFP17838.1 hypothetical protein SAMN05421839_10819 [Halolactibacillus halophilus]